MIGRLEKERCVGCSACAAACPVACIGMAPDEEGFLRPRVDAGHCTGCGICERCCPVLSTEAVASDVLPDACLAWTRRDDDLMAATSGGVFTAMARSALEAGGVVVGAAYAEDHVVRHVLVDSVENLYSLSRSKYVQSDMGQAYSAIEAALRAGTPVLYCGMPCQAYALKAYCKARRLDDGGLTLVDLVCHGVPSPKLLSEYVKWHESTRGLRVRSVAMRERHGRGDYGTGVLTRVEYDDGGVYVEDAGADIFGRFFWGEYSSRPSCYQCEFKTTGRATDLTLGDCWFSRCLTGDEATPFEVTLCLVHSPRGHALLEGNGDISSERVDPLAAIKCNGGMIYSSGKKSAHRAEFFEALGSESLGSIADRLTSPPDYVNRKSKIARAPKAALKRLIGILRPDFFEERRKAQQQEEFESRMEHVVPDESMAVKVFRDR